MDWDGVTEARGRGWGRGAGNGPLASDLEGGKGRESKLQGGFRQISQGCWYGV